MVSAQARKTWNIILGILILILIIAAFAVKNTPQSPNKTNYITIALAVVLVIMAAVNWNSSALASLENAVKSQ